MSTMLVVITVRTVLKVPFEKAAPPPCPFDVSAPLNIPILSHFLGQIEADPDLDLMFSNF